MRNTYTLLLIDYNSGYRDVLMNLLSSHFHDIEVTECRNCAEAHRLIHHTVPDIVILDLNLPDGNGLSIIQDIRTCSADTRIIVLSCSDHTEYQSIARKLGADIFLSKNTLTPDQCLNTIAAVIQPPSG